MIQKYTKHLKRVLFSSVFLSLGCTSALATGGVSVVTVGDDDRPVFKIDCNIAGRREAEVNEPGYTPWPVVGEGMKLYPTQGVSVILEAKGNPGQELGAGYYKAGIQEPHLARLVGDAVRVDNDAELVMRIKGLPVGTHTIQTYHNNCSVGSDTEVPSFDVYAQGRLVHAGQKCTRRVLVREDVLILTTAVEVTHAGEEVVMRFVPEAGAKDDVRAVYLNGIEVNTPDVLLQAHQPVPAHADAHAAADQGTLTLQWKSGKDAVRHHLYVGTDSATVAKATTADVPCYRGALSAARYELADLYSMDTYYWRVDEERADGRITRGTVWHFRPRQLAFRGAEGYGRFAIGGRGGKVVYVTNLNDAGPGSLREAVTKGSGPRTIVFAVSGTIHLKDRLSCNSRYVTIAGQTAPGKGICIAGAPFGIGSDGICRFIRVRLGHGRTFDGIGMAGADHSITDHCSISWTIDEAFSSRGAKNITLQKTLISEALNIAGHKNYAKGKGHGYAATIGGRVGSFHHNLLAHCAGRNWSMGGGLDGNGYYSGQLDIFNNVVYNWGGRATDGGAHEVNFVGNYYKAGPSTTQMYILRAQLEGVGKGSQSYYCAGNVLQHTDGRRVTDNEQLRRYELSNKQVLDWDVWVDKPFFPSQAVVQTADEAYKATLSDVGCNMPLSDAHDQRVIGETLAGTYTYTGSQGNTPGIIDHEQDAGGYENYPEERRPANFDSDFDGLPDWWEVMHGTDPHSEAGDFSEANADPDHDGYTRLEDYLEWMSVPHYDLVPGASKVVDLAPLFRGYEQPVYTVSGQGVRATIDGTKLTVATDKASKAVKGIVYLDVTARDAEGSSLTRRIGVCVR